MIGTFLHFLEERTGWGRRLEDPPGISALGKVIVALLLLQAGTGFALSLHYAPTTTDAWGSVFFIETALLLGGWIRSLHHWGTSALVVSISLHLLLTACAGRYRRPGEVGWWLGLSLLVVVLAFGITGNPLPWNQAGYWGVRIEGEIMGSVPVLGPWLKGLFLGGNQPGNLTLTRMYALHVIALPLVVAGIARGMWSQAKRHAPPADRGLGGGWGWIAAGAAVAILAIVAWTLPVSLGAPAEITSAYQARPAWYFLPLNQWMALAPHPLVGVLLPPIGLGFLAALPLLDRREAFATRLPWLGGIGIGTVGLLFLTLFGLSVERDPAEVASDAEDTARALVVAAQGIPPDGPGQMMARDPLTLGKRIFARECAPCHLVGGEGTDQPNGPDLAGYLSKEWIQALIEDPSDRRFFGTTDIDEMESYHDEDPVAVREVAAFVATLRQHPDVGPDDFPEDLAGGLARFEELECSSCHELVPGEEGAAANLSGYGSDPWLRSFIRQPDDPLFYGSSNEMPSYEPEELSDEELTAVITWLRRLESLPVAPKEPSAGRASAGREGGDR